MKVYINKANSCIALDIYRGCGAETRAEPVMMPTNSPALQHFVRQTQLPVFVRNSFVNLSSVTYKCGTSPPPPNPNFYCPRTNAINPQNAASEMFRSVPVSTPLSVVDDMDAETEEEVADTESPVSDGPDDADAAV